MSHTTGRIIARNHRVGPDSGSPATTPGRWEWTVPIDPAAQGGGPPRFVMLHFTAAKLSGGSVLELDLGYGVDRWDASSGGSFWSRPIDSRAMAVTVGFIGTTGGVTVAEYASSEPTTVGVPGTAYGSTTNCDPFLHTNPYQEPVYETRLFCNGAFDWDNARPAATTAGERAAVDATGMIVAVHRHDAASWALSTCSGTLIGPDLFLTARHCLTEPDGSDIASASVTFDFETGPGGVRPVGYALRWFKVTRLVSAAASPTAYDITTDWMILQLDTGATGTGRSPAALRSTRPAIGETAIAVHHPHGATKKLQRRVLQSGDVNLVHDFDFAGGSSGSALFDTSGRIIGATLSQGPLGSPCLAGYVAAPDVLSLLANPPKPPAPFDVMVVMDRSGSMASPGTAGSGRTKIVEARDAAAEFVRLVRSLAGDRIGVVSFSTTANLDRGLLAVDNATVQQLVGPAPYTSGIIGSITPTSLTSIGAGLETATNAMPQSGNRRAILLLTDGLENTAPWIDDVEGMLKDEAVFVIGYGSDADLDGPRMTRLARDHRGIFLRANSGLALRKYFGLCFGNIFQAGLLKDPEFVLPAGQSIDQPMTFEVCDETEITVVVGWEAAGQDLVVELIAPDGTTFGPSSGLPQDRGLTWRYLKVPLPARGNRDGTWTVQIQRDDHQEDPGSIRYFIAVVADGGPILRPFPPTDLVRPGEDIPIRVGLHYPDGTIPANAEVDVTITAPQGSLEQLVSDYGTVSGGTGADPLSDWTATLQAIAAANGGELPIPTADYRVTLFDDGAHDDGAMEPDGIFGVVPPTFTKYEGTYTFHARARYGDTCRGTREAIWSITVGLDGNPYHTEATPQDPDRASQSQPKAAPL